MSGGLAGDDEIASGPGTAAAGSRWFAVRTRSRQEKAAAVMLALLGVTHFLPLKTERRQWSDRKQTVSLPLFGGYLFVKIELPGGDKLRVLKIPGVAGFVGNSKGPVPVPDHQIEAVRAVVAAGLDCTVHPLLEEGGRVRVLRGVLAGVEGRLLRMNSSSRLVISIELIHRSLAVTIARSDVEPVEGRAA
jgi:transcription antitermination factor NusG